MSYDDESIRKENKRLIQQLEHDISLLLAKFESNTGLCVTNLMVNNITYTNGTCARRVEVESLSISESEL